MKQSMDLQTLIQTATLLDEQKEDFICPTTDLDLDLDLDSRNLMLNIKHPQAKSDLVCSPHAERQFASLLGIGSGTYQRFKHETPSILQTAIPERKRFLDLSQDHKFVRTVDNHVRSVHSSSYFPIDSQDVLKATLECQDTLGLEIASCHIDQNKLFMKMVCPDKLHEVEVGDPVRFGLFVSNNEVGMGRVQVIPFMERLVCTNGMVVADFLCEFKKTHRGKNKAKPGSYIYNKLSMPWDEQVKKRDVFKGIQSTIKQSMNSDSVQKIMEKIQEAKQEKIHNFQIDEIMDDLEKNQKLSQREKDNVIVNFNQDNDHSLWGLVNAVTRTAEDAESYHRATELETLGGALLTGSVIIAA